MQICGYAICGPRHQENLRIFDLRINHYKFAYLRFADWLTSEICGFSIAEWAQELRIYDLRTSNKNLRAHLCSEQIIDVLMVALKTSWDKWIANLENNCMLPGSWSSIGASQVDLAVQYLENKVTVTLNTMHRKFHTNIPRNETARPRSQFLYLCISERYACIHDWSTYFAAAEKDGPIVGINKSLTDTWMWKFGTRPRSFIFGNT